MFMVTLGERGELMPEVSNESGDPDFSVLHL